MGTAVGKWVVVESIIVPNREQIWGKAEGAASGVSQQILLWECLFHQHGIRDNALRSEMVQRGRVSSQTSRVLGVLVPIVSQNIDFWLSSSITGRDYSVRLTRLPLSNDRDSYVWMWKHEKTSLNFITIMFANQKHWFGVLPYLALFVYSCICFLLFCTQFDLNISARSALGFLAVTLPHVFGLWGFWGDPQQAYIHTYLHTSVLHLELKQLEMQLSA